MRGYILNIEKETLSNSLYRKVLFTTEHSQLVLMSIEPGDEIGEEIHDLDQFIRLEQGTAEVLLDDETHTLTADMAVVIPKGTKHNLTNTGTEPLKLYSLYTPPEHRFDVVHQTKEDESEEHFDGRTSLS